MSDLDNLDNLDDFDELDEALDIVSMVDENGDTVQLVVIDGIEADSGSYLLVVLEEDVYEDEPEAIILKETENSDTDSIYSFVEDDDEYDKILALFQNNDTDYELK